MATQAHTCNAVDEVAISASTPDSVWLEQPLENGENVID